MQGPLVVRDSQTGWAEQQTLMQAGSVKTRAGGAHVFGGFSPFPTDVFFFWASHSSLSDNKFISISNRKQNTGWEPDPAFNFNSAQGSDFKRSSILKN